MSWYHILLATFSFVFFVWLFRCLFLMLTLKLTKKFMEDIKKKGKEQTE